LYIYVFLFKAVYLGTLELYLVLALNTKKIRKNIFNFTYSKFTFGAVFVILLESL